MAAFKVLILAFGLLIELDILDIYFYQPLSQAFILLLFDYIKIVANKISLYSTFFTILRLSENSSQ